jgi:hypothetical protein
MHPKPYIMTRLFTLMLLLGTSKLTAQKPTQSFNPLTDSVAVWSEGKWTLPIATKTLTTSLVATTPELVRVRDVRVLMIRQHPFIVFQGEHKDAPGTGYFVAIRLKETRQGVFCADQLVQTCTGNPCQACNFSSGSCVCEEYYDPDNPLSTGSCNHSISRRMALAQLVDGKTLPNNDK